MDERHWWFATKLQETFHIGAQDSPTMLEDFMAEQTTLDYINDFLAIGGHTKLFFYSPKPNADSLVLRRMFVTNTTAKLREVLNEECICLYFLRSEAGHVIDSNRVEKEVFCGEIKESPLSTLSLLMSDVFAPILRAQKEWQCSEESVGQFFTQFDKLTSTLSEYASASVAPQPILKRSELQVTNDFKQNRAAAINPMVLSEYEALVTDWIHTIENILCDGMEERGLDGLQGPLSELHIWHRRQKQLIGVTEQLKSKECKGVIGILITGKSKVLKRWKFIDASITDAFNETKDKVKYLDTLKKYFEQLYSPTITVSALCNVALPGIIVIVRQMEAVSRFYARTGYLGYLFAKVANQVVHAAKQYLSLSIVKKEKDCLWTCVEQEIKNCENSVITTAFVKSKAKKKQIGGEITVGTTEDTFLARLQSCLVLQKQYRDMIRSIRDSFGFSHSTTVMNSVTPAASPQKRHHLPLGNTLNVNPSPSRTLPSQLSTAQGHVKFRDTDSTGSTQPNSGVALTDEDTVFNSIEIFCTRVRNMIDIINTLSQFTKLCKSSENLPRLPPEATGDEDFDEVDEEETATEPTRTTSEESIEEEEIVTDQPSVASELTRMVEEMKDALVTTVNATTFLDTHGKDRDVFEQAYTNFVGNVRKIESYITQYIHGIFTLKLSIEEALKILLKFDCVLNRVGIRSVFSEKYVAVFSNFDDELEEVQNLYETQKESPPLCRNAAVVSGAITWSRSLLRRIEEPMKIFKENKFITSLRDFSRIVKFYNKIATALVRFESLWLTMWKSRIESARSALKLPLLAYHYETKELIVNADERILELIQECKGLQRFDIPLPENALDVLGQEKRFKDYKQNLEFLLKEYNDICLLIPDPLLKLAQPHVDSVLQFFQPGLANLTWNSMNIDAYLHQVHLANMRLRNIVENMKEVESIMHTNIGLICKSVLFDVELAYSRRWPVGMFVSELKEAIKDKQKILFSVLKSIENSIQDVVNIATHNRSLSPHSQCYTPRLSVSPKSGRHAHIVLEPLTTRAGTSVSGLTDEGTISEIFVHYYGLAHQSLIQCIKKSLELFYHCVCPSEVLRERERSPSITSSRPSSAASNLSLSSEWSVVETSNNLIQFEVEIKYNIPDIVITPTLTTVQSAVNDVAKALVDICENKQWWAADTKETLHLSVVNNSDINTLVQSISDVVTSLQNSVDRQISRFCRYDFLWKEDLHGLYRAFVDTEPTTVEYKNEVDRLQNIEKNILDIPLLLTVGSISLNTTPVKDSLHGLAVAWKIKYSTELHDEAKAELQQLVEYREKMKERLAEKVITLDNLNKTLKLLQELSDKDNTIDEVYLPVENSYSMLREYNLSLPRKEVEEVNSLRDKWQELIEHAEHVRYELMVEKRNIFEQELDRDVKRFIVEVIQFRNSFDSQGPGVVGVDPASAVARLHNFQQAYSEYEAKRKILDAVQLLFGVTPTLFPELDRTGEELVLLGLLYGLFQQYISFDESFRNKLWADVDLIHANYEVEKYWQNCLKLPPRIQEWQAYKEMKSYIAQYLNVFPILHKLASKEIRNRHWLQVMSVTGSSFQLEANVFKLSYLLDIDLIKHENEIKEICSSASRELELEVKMRSTEEEWTEQVLVFDKLKQGTLYCLSNSHTEGLLELLEDAQSSLAVMLTSKYIGPLRNEAAAWAIKLKEIGEVLEQWLAVQDFWRYLKTVFSDNTIAKELPQECARFIRIDKSYMKMTKRAQDVKNVLQCCVGGDVPKIQVLRHMYEELETCFKSLQNYLDCKRKAFPRFYFVSDSILLAILSQPYTLDSVKPHLKSLFIDIADITLTTRQTKPSLDVRNPDLLMKPKRSPPTEEDRGLAYRKQSALMSSDHDVSRSSSSRAFSSQVSMNVHDWIKPTNNAVAVVSERGETLPLKKEVFLSAGVEIWLNEILKVLQDTVHDSIVRCLKDVKSVMYIDELAMKYPPQVAYLALLYMWTKECEVAIGDIRVDRKALPNGVRRFWAIIGRLPNILIKGCWRNGDVVTPANASSLEALLAYGMYLRDIVDDLGKRKLRDVCDFEWRRHTRFYGKIKAQSFDGKPRHLIQMLENSLEYGNEFYGCRLPIVVTPGTERYVLALSMAKLQFQCGAIVGQTNAGKTETARGVAQILGHYFLSLSCTPNMCPSSLAKIISGLAQDGCWGIFDEFHRASPAVIAVVVHYVHIVIDALRSKKTSCLFDDGKEISIKPSFNLLLTAHSKSFSMSTELKGYFRTVAVVMPDMSLILRAHCAGRGFKSPKILADRLAMMAKVCQDQLRNVTPQTFSLSSLISVIQTAGKQRAANVPVQTKLHMMPSEINFRPTSNTSLFKAVKTVENSRKPTTPSQLTPAGKIDHALVMKILQECIGPRLSQEDLGIFNSIVRDVFSGMPRLTNANDAEKKERQSFETMLVKHVQENGLVAKQTWIEKILQLHQLSQHNNGLLVVGGAGTGKTTCVTSLVDTLSRLSLTKHGHTGSQVHTHKLQRINPLAVSDLSLMFGCINANGDWMDGIFTSYWKKANKEHNVHRTTTWLCLDAPLHEGWAENLCSVLDDAKYLTLDNCERLHLSDDVKIVFETDNMCKASPAIVSRTAVIYMDDEVLGWRPLAEAWLHDRPSVQRDCILKIFNATVDSLCQLVMHDVKLLITVSEVGLFTTCLALLKALIDNNTDIAGELHIERLCLFSLIWSFGVLLQITERKKFSENLMSVASGLPDYDQNQTVFDYYVDESGEWELWASRVPDESYFDSADFLGEVFVESDHTVRVRFLMELAKMAGCNILLSGPAGAGKTCLMDDFLSKQVVEDKTLIVRRHIYTGNSNAAALQRFVESNIHHRQGYDYGARNGKRLCVYVEDLNLPTPDEYGVQNINELLRQVLGDQAIYKLQKPFERRQLEDVFVVATMNTCFKAPASGKQANISERLKRHFAIFRLQASRPSPRAMFAITTCVLEANMSYDQGMGLPQELHEQIVNATCSLIKTVQDVLRPSPTPGRYHYNFNLRDMARIFQGMKNCPEETRADDDYVLSLWQHEVYRVIGDRISRCGDISWFERTVKSITKEFFPNKPANSPPQFFVTFPTDTKQFYSGRSGSKTARATHQAIESLDDVIPCLQAYLKRYNDEFPGAQLNLMLSTHVISHIVRIHRILSIKNKGNLLLIGVIGSRLSDLSALALYMLDYPLHPVDCTNINNFLDGLRSAVRRAGCDGKTTILKFTGRDLVDDSYLDAVNSLLISGEYSLLFSEDETNSLIQALMPTIKRKFSSFLTDPMKFFLTRVQRNLHIILCVEPTDKLISEYASNYPGILANCHINWVRDFCDEALMGRAKHFLQKHEMFQDDFSSSLIPSIVSTLSSIHKYALNICHQIPWAGENTSSLNVNVKKELKTSSSADKDTAMDEHYTKTLLRERIALAHRQDTGQPNEVFVGPKTFHRFLHCFKNLLEKKQRDLKEKLKTSRLCLETLSKARQDAENLKEHITSTKSKFKEATSNTAELLVALTAKSTTLERLKAKLGVGSDTLRSFIEMIDNEIDFDDELILPDDEKDELDEEFEKMKVDKLKSKRARTKEEIAMAKREEERLKVDVNKAKEVVLLWQERLDRSCCERLKAIQNPPTMVSMVMLMTMVLLGKPEFSHFGTPTTTTEESGSVASSSGKRRAKSDAMRTQQTFAGILSDGKCDRATWKAIQQIMGDSQKFADALHSLNWREGLADDIVAGIRPFFAENKDGELGREVNPEIPTLDKITVNAARYSSEDVVILVEYVLALLDYTKQYKPYKKIIDYIANLSAEQDERVASPDLDKNITEELSADHKVPAQDPEPELGEADLPRLEEELYALQEQFDKAVVIKYNLQNEVNTSSERLRVAQQLLERFRKKEQTSRAFVEEYSSLDVLLSNCLSVAAFLSYCGPLRTDMRNMLVAHFTKASVTHGLPRESKQVFYDVSMCEYLNGKVTAKIYEQAKLPTDKQMLDNICLINQDETSNSWSLVCDPQRAAQNLVTVTNSEATVVKYKEIRSQLETCLMEGTTLFVTDVDVSALVEDDKFYYILRHKLSFLKATSPFKLLVGEHEIECQPSFRLFMCTTTASYQVPRSLAAFLNVVDICLSRDGLQDQFLDRFMKLEKSRVQDSRIQLVSELVRLLKKQQETEQRVLRVLIENRDFLKDLATMKKIASMKRSLEETVESITRTEQAEASVLQSREAFRPIARRAAVFFDAIRHMEEINPVYKISWAQFLKVFDIAIKHSERTAVKAVAERVGQSAFSFAVQGFLEKDRTLFALLFAIEVEDSCGNIGAGDREFLVYPPYGAAVKSFLNQYMTASQIKISNAKKPFDWITDEQFNNLQMLAQSFEWFQEPFDKMSKDGREMQWRQLIEHEIPELVALPENLDEKYTPMQRFMVIRSIRPDRLTHASRSFIIQGLGRRYATDVALDLNVIHRQGDCASPVLLLYEDECSILENMVRDLASKKQVEVTVVHLTTAGSNQGRHARRILHKAMQEGSWLMFQDGHNDYQFLDTLDSLISDNKQIDNNFRLWISAKISSPLPTGILQLATKVVVDSPKNIRDNLIRSMSLLDDETFNASVRSEWPAVLHNICMLHNVIRLRSQYHLVGWNKPQDINPTAEELHDAIKMAAAEFGPHTTTHGEHTPTPGKSIQWNALRYMLAEIVYGKGVSDEFDRCSLSALVDFWISPAAVKKEFEASRVKYRLPSVFFAANARLPTLLQSLESLPANVLDVPEACGLHASSETILARDQYTFTHLNWIYDRMQMSGTLTHACTGVDYYTPTKGVAVISGQTNLPGASSAAVEKIGIFASASLVALRQRKDVDMLDVCNAALSKVPRPWNKETITEKLKRGGVTSFSLFVLSEVEQMQKLIQEMREDLQVIKAAAVDGVHGDLIPPNILEVADALFCSRIPAKWLHLAGNTAPPAHWGLLAWLGDVQSRHSHIDRVLSQGRDRVPAYWLGAFFNPRRLLAIIKQEAVRNCESSGRTATAELFVFQTEITGRDKDHLREPPLEGLFVYGVHMWGCAWEKTTGDLLDAPPRQGPTPLPVVHITAVPQSEKQNITDPQRSAVTYSCPCYPSRISSREPVVLLDIDNKDVSSTRWSLRGLSATLRPF